MRSCACGGGCPRCAAPSLTRGAASHDDPAETEADRIADALVTGAPPSAVLNSSAPRAAGEQLPATVGAAIAGPGTLLEPAAREFLEPRLGVDLGEIRVHTDSAAATSARAVGALAYTVGRDIVFDTGRYAPDTAAGRRLLAHEVAHTLQQARGGPRLQRQASGAVADEPCPSGYRDVDVFVVVIQGATRSVETDVATANAIFAQCCIRVNLLGPETWSAAVMEIEEPHDMLDTGPSFLLRGQPDVLTAEESALLAHRPGGENVLHAYYLPDIDSGKGLAYLPGSDPVTVPSFIVNTRVAEIDTFAHELGHVLLGSREWQLRGHSDEPGELMAGRRDFGVDRIPASDCRTMGGSRWTAPIHRFGSIGVGGALYAGMPALSLSAESGISFPLNAFGDWQALLSAHATTMQGLGAPQKSAYLLGLRAGFSHRRTPLTGGLGFSGFGEFGAGTFATGGLLGGAVQAAPYAELGVGASFASRPAAGLNYSLGFEVAAGTRLGPDLLDPSLERWARAGFTAALRF